MTTTNYKEHTMTTTTRRFSRKTLVDNLLTKQMRLIENYGFDPAAGWVQIEADVEAAAVEPDPMERAKMMNRVVAYGEMVAIEGLLSQFDPTWESA